MIPQQVAVGLALQAIREALETYGLLPGTRAAITTDAERRMVRLLEELEAAEPDDRQEPETGHGTPQKAEAEPRSGTDTMSGPGDGNRAGAVPNEQSGGRGV